jgi:hypothetical protein
VLLFGWDVRLILVAYWLENGVVGLLAIPKILLANPSEPTTTAGHSSSAKIVLAIFFPIHYGIFWVVHGVFVFFLTGLAAAGALGMFGASDVVGNVVAAPSLLLVAGALLASHLTSFFVNYLGRSEYLRTTPAGQAIRPYARVVVLHLTVLLGGFAVLLVGEPVALVALLVVLKTVVDLVLHLIEHRLARPAAKAAA